VTMDPEEYERHIQARARAVEAYKVLKTINEQIQWTRKYGWAMRALDRHRVPETSVSDLPHDNQE